ncbi:MAG: ABC transporter substrate-binding protein [Deltaproteobacteria bacterium]|nr:ABC transporter substrate-binding protein [Deltaproteobacteria bacterium]
MRNKTFYLIGLALLWDVLSILFLVPVSVDAGSIKIGIIDCYSGPPALYAKDALNGFKLAVSEINKKTALGKKIEYIARDSKFKVDHALNLAKQLVMRKEVDVLVGTINSPAALAISEAVAKKQKVPFIVWMSKSERITGEKGHRYVFSSGENTAMAGKAAGIALSKKPYIKYWVAGDHYEYGHAMADAAWRNLRKMKPEVTVIGKSWWKPGEPDLIPYITSILEAKPEAAIFCTGAPSMTNVMKAIKTTDMAQKVPIWIHTATDHTMLKPLNAEAPEGVLGTTDYHFYHPDIRTNKEFVAAFRAAYGNPPGSAAFHGYITAHFIAEAFKKAGAANKEKFIDALEGLKIESPIGPIEMRACDHQAALPVFLGKTKRSAKYGFVISSNIVTFRGDDVMPTCEEIMAARMK